LRGNLSEGGRAYDGVMKNFKSGIGKLYLETGVPILPVALKGTNEIFPPHGQLKWAKLAEVYIGKPKEFIKEYEQAQHLDKNSEKYHNLGAAIVAQIEQEVRILAENH